MPITEKQQKQEQLKDRRDLRQALIVRRNGLDVKIKNVERQIHRLEMK